MMWECHIACILLILFMISILLWHLSKNRTVSTFIFFHPVTQPRISCNRFKFPSACIGCEIIFRFKRFLHTSLRVLIEILSGSFPQSFLTPSGFWVKARGEGPTQAVLWIRNWLILHYHQLAAISISKLIPSWFRKGLFLIFMTEMLLM